MVSLGAILVATSANAGLLESLGLVKKSEPATLEEACDTAEIKKVCPEVVLGTKTIPECLSENVKSLSSKCATFVKKSIADKKDAAIAKVASVKADLNDKATNAQQERNTKGAEAKEALSAKVDAVKSDIAAKKAAAEDKVAADKAAASAKKAEVKAAGQEIANAVRETGAAAKDTGKAIKEMF